MEATTKKRDGPLDWVRVLVGHLTKAGARHSKADNEIIQAMHDNAVTLGADCPTKSMYHQASLTGGAFAVFKALDGPRWVGVVSNNYRDLQGEIITQDAHKEFLAWLDANPAAAPELWTWHTPGTARKARADWWALTDGGFVWMSGPLTDAEAGQFKAGEVLGMSHGFYAVKAGTDIVRYRSFEVSELPLQAAANVWTQFGVKGETMAFDPQKREFLASRFGETFVTELEQQDEARAKTLKDSGVEFKAGDVPAQKAPGDPVAPAAPAVQATAPAEGDGEDVPSDPLAAAAQSSGECAAMCLQAAAVAGAQPSDGARKFADAAMKCAQSCRAVVDAYAALTAAAQPAALPGAPAMPAAPAAPAPMAASLKEDDPAEVKAREAQALKEALTGAIVAATAPLQAQVAALAAQVEALKATDDAKIAQAMLPRVAPQQSAVNKDNEVAAGALPAAVQAVLAKEKYDWLPKAPAS